MNNIQPPQPGESFADFYKRSPIEIQKDLDRLKNEWKRNLKNSLKTNLQTILDTENRHHQIIKTCAKVFAGTTLSKKTGYQFYFLEPLYEKAGDKKGNSIFDLFLYNPTDSSAIFIECKSSSKRSSECVKQIKNARRLVLDNLDYFSKKLDIDLDPEKIEFVECLYFDDTYDACESISSQSAESGEKGEIIPVDINVWEFFQGTEEIRLCKGYKHKNPHLTAMISQRYGRDELHDTFDVPYYLNLHPFLIIINIILTYCYSENLSDDSIEDKKIISKNQIFKHLMDNAFFGLNKSEIKTTLTKLLDTVIQFGVRCDLFEIQDSEYIRIKCQGSRLKVVKDNLTKKYFENWADCKSRERAEFEALNDIKANLKKAQSTLKDFKLD